MTRRLDDNFVPIRYPADPPRNDEDRKLQVRWKHGNTAALLDIRTAAGHLHVLRDHFSLLVDFIAFSYLSWQRRVTDAPAQEKPPVAAAPAPAPADSPEAVLIAELQQLSDIAAVSPLAVATAKVKEELGLYVAAVVTAVAGKAPKDKLKEDLLKWWRENKVHYPHLAHVVRMLLAGRTGHVRGVRACLLLRRLHRVEHAQRAVSRQPGTLCACQVRPKERP
jgi:hypothetical protein